MMSRIFGIVALALILCAGYAPPASANTIYTYTGNPFTSFSGTLPAGVSNISGSFTMSNPLGPGFVGLVTPLSFSFTDGATTVTQASSLSGHQVFDIFTNATGVVTVWTVFMAAPAPGGFVQLYTDNGIFDKTQYLPDFNVGTLITGSAQTATFGSTGTWSTTSTVVTPEPSSLILLGSGLLGLVGAARRRLRV